MFDYIMRWIGIISPYAFALEIFGVMFLVFMINREIKNFAKRKIPDKSTGINESDELDEPGKKVKLYIKLLEYLSNTDIEIPHHGRTAK